MSTGDRELRRRQARRRARPRALALEEIEGAVRAAGYGVAKTEEAERPPFWRTPRALLTVGSALLFLAGLALSVTGAPEISRVAAYLAAIVVGGVPIFRAAIVGLRARHLDMNVLMSAATVGAVGIGQWAEAASVVVLFAAGNALQVYAIDRTRGAVRALVRLAPNEVLVRRERLRGRRPGRRGRSRRYGGRQARREACGGR